MYIHFGDQYDQSLIEHDPLANICWTIFTIFLSSPIRLVGQKWCVLTTSDPSRRCVGLIPRIARVDRTSNTFTISALNQRAGVVPAASRAGTTFAFDPLNRRAGCEWSYPLVKHRLWYPAVHWVRQHDKLPTRLGCGLIRLIVRYRALTLVYAAYAFDLSKFYWI